MQFEARELTVRDLNVLLGEYDVRIAMRLILSFRLSTAFLASQIVCQSFKNERKQKAEIT
jgi:hypothetical protein